MKNTITINPDNNTAHIILLDRENVPITIKKLPKTVAYKIQNVPILTTTSETLKKLTINEIRQKNKTITKPTHVIIIENSKERQHLKTETIKENPQITVHATTPGKLPETLLKIHEKLTPKNDIQIKLNETGLYQKNRKIKTYPNTEYAETIMEKLRDNPELTLQEAEYRAQKEYYKHISFDKTNQTYKLTINSKTINRYQKLTHALQEKEIRTKNTDCEEETLCQNQENNTDPLPPTPWNNPIHQLYKSHDKYTTTKHENTPKYNNPDVAIMVKMRKTEETKIRNIQKPHRNLTQKKKTYHITKQKNKQQKTYYKTGEKMLAMYIRDKLEENNYQLKKDEITPYENLYIKEKENYKKDYLEQYKTIDYYNLQTTKLKKKRTYKEQYQLIQIKKRSCGHVKTNCINTPFYKK